MFVISDLLNIFGHEISSEDGERMGDISEASSGHAISMDPLSANRVEVVSGQHVIILRVDNVFDTRYRDHLSRVEERNFPMPGRNLSLSYRWFF